MTRSTRTGRNGRKATIKDEPSRRFLDRHNLVRVYGPTGETPLNQQLRTFLVSFSRNDEVQTRRKKTFSAYTDEAMKRIIYFFSLVRTGEPDERYPIITFLFASPIWTENVVTLFLNTE